MVISDKILEKYFAYLKHLDNTTKKNLIIKLTKSLEIKSPKPFDIQSIYGAWEDDRSSDQIISEIKSSRVEKGDTMSLVQIQTFWNRKLAASKETKEIITWTYIYTSTKNKLKTTVIFAANFIIE